MIDKKKQWEWMEKEGIIDLRNLVKQKDQTKDEYNQDSLNMLCSRVDDLYDKCGALELKISSLEQTILDMKGEMHDDKY